MARLVVVRRGPERLRIGAWRSGTEVGYLLPLAELPAPTASMVDHCCGLLEARGYTEVLTGALTPIEQRGFLDAGFVVQEELYLLSHDLQDLPTGDRRVALRRPRPAERDEILAVDTAAFPPFWQLDDDGLAEAVAATPAARLRVAVAGGVAGYCITGRAGRRGYVQRLAVAPNAEGHGFGGALLADGLRWLRRRGAERAVVNTQVDNERARRLYESVGFRLAPVGLAVLTRPLGLPATSVAQ